MKMQNVQPCHIDNLETFIYDNYKLYMLSWKAYFNSIIWQIHNNQFIGNSLLQGDGDRIGQYKHSVQILPQKTQNIKYKRYKH